MFCASCGKQVDEADPFCRHCGRSTAPQARSAASRNTVASVNCPSLNTGYVIAAIAIVFVLIVLASLFGNHSNQQPEQPKPAPAAQPPTVVGVYPKMLGEQIKHLQDSIASSNRVKAAHDAAIDSGNTSFACHFSLEEIEAEAEVNNGRQTLKEYRERHSVEIKALRRRDSNLNALEAKESGLELEFHVGEAMIGKICQ